VGRTVAIAVADAAGGLPVGAPVSSSLEGDGLIRVAIVEDGPAEGRGSSASSRPNPLASPAATVATITVAARTPMRCLAVVRRSAARRVSSERADDPDGAGIATRAAACHRSCSPASLQAEQLHR
jgi:hypothetical protein